MRFLLPILVMLLLTQNSSASTFYFCKTDRNWVVFGNTVRSLEPEMFKLELTRTKIRMFKEGKRVRTFDLEYADFEKQQFAGIQWATDLDPYYPMALADFWPPKFSFSSVSNNSGFHVYATCE